MTPLRPALFTRPLPVLAAVVLTTNDHWLKASDIAPAWLTGKLSDFAGLFFFPLLVAELWCIAFPAVTRRAVEARLCVAAAAGGLLFAAINLSEWSSDVYAEMVSVALSPVGARAANVADPGDLIALPALFVAVVYGRRVTSWRVAQDP